MGSLENKDREQLEAELAAAQDDLEELELEQQASLGTGHHMWAEQAASMRERFEKERAELQGKIDRLRGALEAKRG